MAVPLYSYEHEFQGHIPERCALKLERDGIAKLVRRKKGSINRAVLHRRPGDPKPTTLRDHIGKAYSWEQPLDDVFMKKLVTFAIFAFFTFTPSSRQSTEMTNETVESMVKGGIQLATILTAIRTAPSTHFSIGKDDYGRLIDSGASVGIADEIFKAMRHRKYVLFEPDAELNTPRQPEEPPTATMPAPVVVASPPLAAPPTTPTLSPLSASQQEPLLSASPTPPAQPLIATAPPPVHERFAMSSVLSDEEVNAAILRGSAGRAHRIGLVLNDVQTAFFSATVCRTCAESGYTIHVYTPGQWIEQLTVNAKREMLPFTIQNVRLEDRTKLLHVVAMPSTPDYLNGNGFALSSSVHRIVLTDVSRNAIMQPVQLTNGAVTDNSAFRSAEFSTANAAFRMSDVEALRAADAKGEFFVTATGSKQVKYFKVKERFFKQLFP